MFLRNNFEERLPIFIAVIGTCYMAYLPILLAAITDVPLIVILILLVSGNLPWLYFEVELARTEKINRDQARTSNFILWCDGLMLAGHLTVGMIFSMCFYWNNNYLGGGFEDWEGYLTFGAFAFFGLIAGFRIARRLTPVALGFSKCILFSLIFTIPLFIFAGNGVFILDTKQLLFIWFWELALEYALAFFALAALNPSVYGPKAVSYKRSEALPKNSKQ